MKKRTEMLKALLEGTNRALDSVNLSEGPWVPLMPLMDECIKDLENREEEVFGGDSHYITDPDPDFDVTMLAHVCRGIGEVAEVIDSQIAKENQVAIEDKVKMATGAVVKMKYTVYACNNCYAIVPTGPQCPECQKGFAQEYILKGTQLCVQDWDYDGQNVWYACDEYDEKGGLVRDAVSLKDEWLEE